MINDSENALKPFRCLFEFARNQNKGSRILETAYRQ